MANIVQELTLILLYFEFHSLIFIKLHYLAEMAVEGKKYRVVQFRAIFYELLTQGVLFQKEYVKGSVSTTKNSPKEKREYRISENLHFHISGSKLLTFHNFIFHALQNAKMGEVNFVNNFT